MADQSVKKNASRRICQNKMIWSFPCLMPLAVCMSGMDIVRHMAEALLLVVAFVLIVDISLIVAAFVSVCFGIVLKEPEYAFIFAGMALKIVFFPVRVVLDLLGVRNVEQGDKQDEQKPE